MAYTVVDLNVSFPAFFAWISELQPGLSIEVAQRVTEDRLNAIITRQLRRRRYFELEDLSDCRNDLLMLMEKKLTRPLRFDVRLVRPADWAFAPSALEVTIMHLLRAEPFAIAAMHPDLQGTIPFCAVLRDLAGDREAARLSGVVREASEGLVLAVDYSALEHEQDAHLEVSVNEYEAVRYHARVKPVRHESLEVRLGFMAATARNITMAHLRKRDSARNLASLEDLPSAEYPARYDHGQDVALLALKREIARLPERLQDELRQHYIDGLSWSEIARLRGVSEAAARKEESRLLRQVAKTFSAHEAEADEGAVGRVVKWVKDMLSQILS